MSKAWPVPSLDADAPLAVNARLILRVRVAEFFHYEPIVHDVHAGVLLHDMRISAKRLRYTLELFAEVFGKAGLKQIARVKEIQEILGEIHDADVRLDLIEDEMVKLAAAQMRELSERLKIEPVERHHAILTSALRPPPDDPRRGLMALLGRQHQVRSAHYVHFLERWDALSAEGMRVDLVTLSASPR
ncbi:MAG: CHAD domain-containing protein [Thermomicrobiales bacterium]